MLLRPRLEGTLPMTMSFDPQQPWVGVMTYTARDGEYWAKQVIRPAQTCLARGALARLTKEAALSVKMDRDAKEMVTIPAATPAAAGIDGQEMPERGGL